MTAQDLANIILIVLGLAAVLAIYFLPYIIARKKNHPIGARSFG